MERRALFSIHDVEPGTLPRVVRLVRLLRAAGLPSPLLLVVAGGAWTAEGLGTLAALVEEGAPLAGHGWSHRAPRPVSLGHRLHALALSRDRAEHLSRERGEVRAIVARCQAWFEEHGFDAPTVYVPPAWALGPLRRDDLAQLPFRYWETLTGMLDSGTGRRLTLPLVGFEADTRVRLGALKVSNAVNLAAARVSGRPVRIGLHPDDLDLLLADDVREIVRRPWRSVSVEEAFASGVRP